MKPAAYLLAIVLVSVCVLAQDSPKQSPKNQSSGQTASAATLPPIDAEFASQPLDNETCYTIRAYFFRQSEDGGVEPAGMTTCVRRDQRALKRAQRDPAKSKPEVRLVH